MTPNHILVEKSMQLFPGQAPEAQLGIGFSSLMPCLFLEPDMLMPGNGGPYAHSTVGHAPSRAFQGSPSLFYDAILPRYCGNNCLLDASCLMPNVYQETLYS